MTCLQVLHIEDNPLSGAFDLAAVGTDNVSVLVMAKLEMLVFDAIVACEMEALWER